MRRAAFVWLSALVVVSCDRTERLHELTFTTAHLTREALPDGTAAYFTMEAFLLGDLARAPRVYLSMHDVSIEAGSEADLYLVSPAAHELVPRLLIASVRGEAAATAPVLTYEVLDFEKDGVKRTPRSELRGLAGVGLALHVKRGVVTAGRMALSSGPPPGATLLDRPLGGR